MVDAGPIKRMKVDSLLPMAYGDGTIVEWETNKDFCSRSLEFAVLVSDNPGGPFERIGATKDHLYVDQVERRLGLSNEVYYTVYSRDQDTHETWRGPVQRVGSAWERRDWRIAREIIRQEHTRLTKGRAGVRGYLLIRREFGDQCACVNDAGKITDPDCQSCYGTGIEGGYHRPLHMWVDQNPDRTMRKLDADQGMISDVLSTWRITAFPPMRSNDIWVDAKTDERWRAGSDVAVIAHVCGTPILVQVQVTKLDRSDSVYAYPVSDDG